VRGTSRSAVSRRFVAMTERALDEMMTADLGELDLVALMIDLARLSLVRGSGIGHAVRV
jgi:hypothetical protein